MTQTPTSSRYPLYGVVILLVMVLAVAFLWPENDAPSPVVVSAPATVVPEPIAEPVMAPQTEEVMIEEEFTVATPISEANVEDLGVEEVFIEPEIVAEPAILDVSDQAIKQALITTLRSPVLSTLIVNESIIANMVATVVNTADGKLPENVSMLTAPKNKFSVFTQGDNQFITPESFTRYNVYAQTFAAIETDSLLRLLNDYNDEITTQFAQITLPNSDFNLTLINAINELLDTPTVSLPIAVESDSVMYRFVNPQLEALSPAQKQLVRMGPDNMRLVKRKLRELRDALSQ